MIQTYRRALIVGAGDGLSASLARLLAGRGLRVGLAARNVDKLQALAREADAVVHPADAARPGDVDALFAHMERALGGAPDVVVYNPSARVRGPLVELDADAVANAIMVTGYGGFLVAQAAARHRRPDRRPAGDRGPRADGGGARALRGGVEPGRPRGRGLPVGPGGATARDAAHAAVPVVRTGKFSAGSRLRNNLESKQ